MHILVKAVRIVLIAETISLFGPPLPIPNRRNESHTLPLIEAVKLAPAAIEYCERVMNCP